MGTWKLGSVDILTSLIVDNPNGISRLLSGLGLAPLSITSKTNDTITEITGLSDEFASVGKGALVPKYKILMDVFGEYQGVVLEK